MLYRHRWAKKMSQTALKPFTDSKYQIIYADPPWRYADQKNNDPAMGGITYPTMSLEEICAMPVNQIAEKNTSLFMWATMPMLKEALQVISAWGFKYTTCAFTWVKLNPSGNGIYSGLGHWTNGNAELCLFAKRGAPKRVAKNVKQIVMSPRGRHSAKPPEVRDRIVELVGDLPRIELFARQKVEGWDYWGNEVNHD
jgi:site-specific DNA-methyltransferase (adenine-specific)